MNAFKTLAAFATLGAAASVAFAQERVPDNASHAAPFASTATRDEVRSQLAQARRDGTLRIYDAEHFLPAPVLDAMRSREAVRAQAPMSRGERRFDGIGEADGRG